ncbi:MAG TPA: hypothetical protein EYH06_08745 [Chromatiales bacterium]|nr:hypothetical protein [Thiotrichales bacterium]HIP68663.1 hypothetical protein [Chromatiales bacterium]
MTYQPAVLLLWHGSETVSTARSLLEKKQSVNIQLAANYHHAFAAHLNPEASKEQSEEITLEGGPELLAHIAEIRGLEEFSDLVEPARQTNASVRLENPALVIISVPE